MEWVLESFGLIESALGPYIPGLVCALLLSIIGKFAKKYVWTRERAVNHWLGLWGRRTLPLHPMITGYVIGLFNPAPPNLAAAGVSGPVWFLLMGAASIVLFDFVKQLLKTEYDFRVELFKDSMHPAAVAEAVEKQSVHPPPQGKLPRVTYPPEEDAVDAASEDDIPTLPPPRGTPRPKA